MLYGTRIVSLEVLLARLTTFFYQYNRNKQGGNEEAWKIKIHCRHSMPFTNYDLLDGINSTFTEEGTDIRSPPLSTIVQCHQDMLFDVMSNIRSISILYNPLEILLHCSFKGFSFPLALLDTDIQTQFFGDLSLEAQNEKHNIIDAAIAQANYVSACHDNVEFSDFYQLTFSDPVGKTNASNTLYSAVLKEMTLSPEKYSKYYSFDSKFQKDLERNQVDLSSASGLNSVCAAVAAVLKSVVIYLCPNSSAKFHVAIPVIQSDSQCLKNKYPLIIHVHHEKNTLLFSSTKYSEAIFDDAELVLESDSSQQQHSCSCGMGRKTTTSSCTSPRCPCANSTLSCTEKCNCRLCDNANGRKFQNVAKFKPCRCGENCQINEKRFCVSSQCNCRKFGHSCTEPPTCHCKKCDNVAGPKVETDGPPKKRQATERLTLLQKSAGKLPDMNSVQFFKSTGQRIIQSIWSDKENLLLKSLIDHVQLSERHVSVKTVANLYNDYADQLSQVRRKTTYQVMYKIRHLNSNRNVCNF
jgi:hypothetical protein